MMHGKISRGIEVFDASAMAQQLGIDQSQLERLYSALGTQPHPAAPSPTTKPVDVVTKFFHAWNTKNLDELEAVLAPEVSGRNPLREVTLSREAMRNAIEQNMAAFPDLHMEIENIVCDHGVVAVEEIETPTFAATGATYRMAVSCFLRVNEVGQITDIHNYWDTDTYIRQLKITRDDLVEIIGHTKGAGHGQ
ncbi:nuclear transport factor 2 family protein [Mycobacterium shigaense]|nr:ester cyclase [Mycobacterium shigaense]